MRHKAGTVDHSSRYRENLLAFCTIRCVLTPNICGFQVFSNQEGFGNLDDIIIIVEYANGCKKAFVFQLKHKTTRRLNKEMLLHPKGDFSLIKYQRSYEEIIQNKKEPSTILKDVDENDITLIIFTNMLYVNNNNEAIRLKPVDDDDYNSFIRTSKKSKVYKIQNGRENLFHSQFLKQLLIYTSQLSSEELETSIGTMLEKEFQHMKKECVLAYIQYISDWIYGRLGKSYPLSYKEIEMKLLEIIVQPYIVLPKITNSPLETEIQWSFWNKAVMVSDLTLLAQNQSLSFVTESSIEILKSNHVWDVFMSGRIFEDASTNNRIIKKVLIRRKRMKGELNAGQIYMTLWELKQLPLILHCLSLEGFEMVTKALMLFSRTIRKFIVIAENTSEACFEELSRTFKIFNNIRSLSTKIAFNILSMMNLSLQGKGVIRLSDLLSEELEEGNFITADMIVQMYSKTIQIGEKFEQTEPYIKRKLKTILLRREVLNEVRTNIFVVFVKHHSKDHIMNAISKNCYMDYDDYISNITNNNVSILQGIHILFLKDTQKEFLFSNLDAIQVVRPEKSIHCLEYLDDVNFYRWTNTFGNVVEIRNYVVKDVTHEHYQVQDLHSLKHFRSVLEMLSTPAGMGKTTVLKYIANNSSPKLFVLYVDVFEYSKQLNSLNFEAEKEVTLLDTFLTLSKTHLEFSKKLFEILLKSGKIVFFIDNVDYFEEGMPISQFIGFVRDLCIRYNNKMWISCRSHVGDKLENKYSRLSIEMESINQEDQLQLLEKTFQGSYSLDMCKSLLNKVNTTLGKNLCGKIFQWKLILDMVSKQDIQQFIENDVLAIDLMRESIEINLDHCATNKESNNIIMYKMALSVIFQDDVLREIIDFDEFIRLKKIFINEAKYNYRQFIISGFTDDESPVFIDRLYIDYLVAYWLVQNITRDTIKQLINKNFYPELRNIKYLFDMLLSQSHTLHKAIVSKNFDKIKKIFENHVGLEEKMLTDVDACHRTPLHLSSTYGTHFDFSTASDTLGIRDVGKHCEVFKFDIYADLSVPAPVLDGDGSAEKIFLFLLDKVAHTNNKLLYSRDITGLNVFDHAYKSGCLYNLNELVASNPYSKLTENQNVFFLKHCYEHELSNILQQASFQCFCSVRVGRRMIFDDLKKGNFLFGSLQKCCEYKLYNKIGVEDCSPSQDDKRNMEDTKNINIHYLETNQEWDGEFHRAARDCNYTKLQEMVSNRLDDEIMNTLSPASFTALHTLVCSASYANNIDNIIKCADLLIDSGIDVNHPDIHNQSVILHAAVRKYKHFVNFLIKKCWDYIDLDNYKQHEGESARKVILKHNLYQGKLPEPKHIFDTKKLLLSSIKGNDEVQFYDLIEREETRKYLNNGDGKNDDISAYTPLQLCLVKNLQKFAEKLIEKGADCFKTIQKNKQKPVEYAISKHNYDLVKLIFDKYDVKDKIARHLLNDRNEMGRTLLHEATYKCHFDFILKLIEIGASLFVEDNQGKIPLDTIHKTILSEHLDNCIDYDTDDDPETIDIEYDTLIDRRPKRKKKKFDEVRYDSSYSNLEALVDEYEVQDIDETKLLSVLRSSSELEDLFSHPTIRTLVDMKLRQVVWLHHINLASYGFFWLLLHLNSFIYSQFIISLLTLFVTILGLEELILFVITSKKIVYIRHFENIISAALLIVTYSLVILQLSNEVHDHQKEYKWLYILTMLLSTIHLLFLVGKNYFVHSIMTYRYILTKYIKYIAPFTLLFVTFSLAHHLLLLSYKEFNSGNILYDLFVRVFVAYLMFSGELKEENLYDDGNAVLGRIVVVLFIFIMSTILANMLLTLLVNDMDEMRHSAMITQYSEKTKYILQAEAFLNYSKNRGTIPRVLSCLIKSPYLGRLFRVNIFTDSCNIEIDLNNDKFLSRSTVRSLRAKINSLIELNRTREHQKLRDIKRLIDKIVSSPNFLYKDT